MIQNKIYSMNWNKTFYQRKVLMNIVTVTEHIATMQDQVDFFRTEISFWKENCILMRC